jgi:Ca2+-binding EF-hand superfamily protein
VGMLFGVEIDTNLSTGKLLDVIWERYDLDGNGHLDIKEAKEFIQEFLKMGKDAQNMTEEKYNAIFALIDQNNDGKIDKEEMKIFMKAVRENEHEFEKISKIRNDGKNVNGS